MLFCSFTLTYTLYNTESSISYAFLHTWFCVGDLKYWLVEDKKKPQKVCLVWHLCSAWGPSLTPDLAGTSLPYLCLCSQQVDFTVIPAPMDILGFQALVAPHLLFLLYSFLYVPNFFLFVFQCGYLFPSINPYLWVILCQIHLLSINCIIFVFLNFPFDSISDIPVNSQLKFSILPITLSNVLF